MDSNELKTGSLFSVWAVQNSLYVLLIGISRGFVTETESMTHIIKMLLINLCNLYIIEGIQTFSLKSHHCSSWTIHSHVLFLS